MMNEKFDFDVCFLGGLYPENLYLDVMENSIDGLQSAANSFQWSLVNGLDNNLVKPVKIINKMFIGSYPKHYRKLLIKKSEFSHACGTKDINVGFLNIAGIKQLSFGSKIFTYLKKWRKHSLGKQKIIFVYAGISEFIQASIKLKNIFPEVKLVLILPDLPHYINMTSNKNLLRTIYKGYNIKKLNSLFPKIDYFVLLTDKMSTHIPPRKPYIVIEGAYNLRLLNNQSVGKRVNNKERILMYSGTLTKKYGIIELLEAFTLIKSDKVKLVICGDGEAKNDILEIVQKDSRIEYKGVIPQKEVLELQQKSTLLVNPRQDNEEYTKFSFPSKLIEYMASGRPVLAYRLPGVPKEYNDYLLYFKDDTIITMSKTIEKYLFETDDFLNSFGEQARRFILEDKNNIIQSRKILSFIAKNLKNEGEVDEGY